MKKTFFALFISITFISCFNLDDNLYNQSKLTAYQLDNYTGEVDFRLDATYEIPDSLIHLFTLSSQAFSESSATTISAIYIGNINKIATDTVIMYCHGNRDHMDFYWQRAKLLAHTGHKNRFGILMIDYRGYGMSEGKPTEEGLYADVNAALQWLKLKGLTSNRLILYGFSMGSAPATKLTAEPQTLVPAKLILQAPFASATVMVQDASGLAMPSSFFTSLQINNAEKIKQVQQPFCWIHGTDDDFLNINTHGEVVYGNYKGAYKEAHRISGAGHSSIETTMGFSTYSKVVEDFITR